MSTSLDGLLTERTSWTQRSSGRRCILYEVYHVPVLLKYTHRWCIQGNTLLLSNQINLIHRSRINYDAKFGNCRGEIVDRRIIFSWSLIHGSGWSGLIKAKPGPGSSFILQSRPTTRPNEFCQLCVSVLEYTARQSVQLVWFLPCASGMVTTGLRIPFSLIRLEKYFRPRNWRTQYQYHTKPAWKWCKILGVFAMFLTSYYTPQGP